MWSVAGSDTRSDVNQTFLVGGSYGNYAAQPEGGPTWKIRATLTPLFPK